MWQIKIYFQSVFVRVSMSECMCFVCYMYISLHPPISDSSLHCIQPIRKPE